MAKCPECEEIIVRYVQAGASRNLAEQELARYRPSAQAEVFQELWEACETARKYHEAAHLELKEHLEQH